MPVRIYALAKELKLDSKDLVDICAKAGITGKGSALASLTDEESDRLKAYLSGGSRQAARPAAVKSVATPVPVLAPSPSLAPAPAATVTVVGTALGTTHATAIHATAIHATAIVEPPPPAPTVTPATVPPMETVAAAAKPTQTGGAMRREDYIAPGGAFGKPKVLEARSDKPPGTTRRRAEGESRPSGKPSAAGPRLAPLPAAQRPPKIVEPKEPTPQKPDIKLPADAIRASKAGSKPLSEHLRKHEQKRLTDAAKPKTAKGGRGAATTDEATTAAAAKGRGRKSKLAGPVEPDSADKSLLGGRAHRQLQRKRGDGRGRKPGEEDGAPTRKLTRLRRSGAKTAAPRKGKVVLQLPCTIRGFCEAVGVPVSQVQRVFMGHGAMMTINSTLDAEQAELLALELGVEMEIKHEVTLEDETFTALDQVEADPSTLQPRPPIITFLGHVDHGKTSLLDRIIGIDVASGESGGITQHIRAYQIERDGRKISFVDTPGHEAFTEMRARGANVTDIAVLVVAADDGVMPQTEEAISHARAAGVPIVVALNKMDLPGVNVDRIYQQLATNELVPAEWSPDGVEVVKTSATTGMGIDKLLETLLLTADLQEFTANPNRSAIGTCLEAQQEPGRGVVAKLMVQRGTLRVGDVVVCGGTSGRVQAMYDTLDTNRHVTEAAPSTPVNVTGLDEVPGAGDHFYVLDDIVTARRIASQRSTRTRQTTLSGTETHVTLENLFDRLGSRDQMQTLNLILRADVRGSIEAIQKEIGKFKHDEVQVKVLQSLVGGITEADVHLAHASDAIIIGFNVVADEAARSLADKYKVSIRRYEIIYKLSEDLKQALEGKLKPEQREVELGRAFIQQTFTISRVGTIAGCRVLSGSVTRNCRVRVIRDSRIIGDYALDSLKREKDDAKEVREGMECGMKLAGFNDLKQGDVLEAYKIEEVRRTLEG